jgi:hypothetical protein
MKTNLRFIMALTAVMGLLVFGGQALSYTVTGDVANGGSYTSTGSLWTLLRNTAVFNGTTTHMYIEGDYVQVTGASGSTLYSVGEINPGFGAAWVALTGNGSGGYNLSGAGRSITGVTNINVVHAVTPVKNGPWIYSDNYTVKSGATLLDTFSLSGTALTDTAGKIADGTISGSSFYAKSLDLNYTGVSLLSMLGGLGINTNNLNQYITVKATDGYATVISIGELVNGENVFLAYKGDPTDPTPSVGPLVTDQYGNVTGGYNGFTRLIFSDQMGRDLWVSRVSSIEVNAAPVPVPATLLLFAPGLAGLAAIKRRFTSNLRSR